MKIQRQWIVAEKGFVVQKIEPGSGQGDKFANVMLQVVIGGGIVFAIGV